MGLSKTSPYRLKLTLPYRLKLYSKQINLEKKLDEAIAISRALKKNTVSKLLQKLRRTSNNGVSDLESLSMYLEEGCKEVKEMIEEVWLYAVIFEKYRKDSESKLEQLEEKVSRATLEHEEGVNCLDEMEKEKNERLGYLNQYANSPVTIARESLSYENRIIDVRKEHQVRGITRLNNVSSINKINTTCLKYTNFEEICNLYRYLLEVRLQSLYENKGNFLVLDSINIPKELDIGVQLRRLKKDLKNDYKAFEKSFRKNNPRYFFGHVQKEENKINYELNNFISDIGG